MAFITEIAKYIQDNYDLSKESLAVIFPNKRAAMMLRLELVSNVYDKNIWLPQILSIQEAMSSWSGLQLLDNIDVVFELIKIINDTDKSLSNDIYGLASQMLKDFDEIDQYAVDANDLFQLTKAAKELGLWTPDENYRLESIYVNFFSSLVKYYNSLRKKLLNDGSGYYGLISRTIYEMPIERICDMIGNKKVIFAGFNAMTTTEENIIVKLVKAEKATLLWDLDEYYFNDEKQEAGTFAREFFKNNPTLTPTFLNRKLLEEKKTINIIGASGTVIQTNALLLELNKESGNPNDRSSEVIVLSDESLLIPVLNSIPNAFHDLQVTMGFPYSKTILNQFLQHLFAFQKNIKSKGNEIYFWSLSRLLDAELIKLMFTNDELKHLFNWRNECLNKSIYYITIEDYEKLKDIPDVYNFLYLFSTKWNSTRECIDSLKSLLKNIYKKIKDNSNFISNQISVAGRIVNKIDKLFVKHEQIIQIDDIETLYRQSSSEMTIDLKGSHDGLQIMGLLETRNLDFKKVHILSVNEGILPQSKGTNSLIPYDIRKYYRLPVYNNKQAVYAYHFYRLLQNAENVNVYYNTLADGMGEGEPSRFIQQIMHEMPDKNKNISITEKIYKSPTSSINKTYKLEAVKDDDTYAKLIKKLSGDNDGKKTGLSPTSISCYLTCPLKFYLQYIEKRMDETPNELIQSNVLGTIIHATLENLYKYFGSENVNLKKYQDVCEKYYDEAYWHALSDNNFRNGFPKTGFNYLSSKIVDKLLKNFINYEKSFLKDDKNFKVIGLERELFHTFDITANGQNLSVNLIGHADRIDQVGDVIRIIDYKTGSIKDTDVIVRKGVFGLDKLTEKSLQLMIYKYLYKMSNPSIATNNIEPGIFGLRRINKGLFSLSNNSETYNDDAFVENCGSQFIGLFSEILNREIPFRQTSDENNCKYCNFKEICKRNANSY